MRTSLPSAFLCFVVASASLHADGPYFRERMEGGRQRVLTTSARLGEFVDRDGAMGLYLPNATERRLAEFVRERRRTGEGGGGNVDQIGLVQTLFSDSDFGNVVLVLWNEDTPNFNDVRLTVVDPDGNVLGSIGASPLPPDILPAVNNFFVTNVPAGNLTFIVEGDGDPARSETEMEILDEQPFADVENFACVEGLTDGAGNCDVVLTWDTPLPLPSVHAILVDDGGGSRFLAQTRSGSVDTYSVSEDQSLTGLLPPGSYQFTNLGFLDTPGPDDNLYRGDFVTTGCKTKCSEDSCFTPINLSVCQDGYTSDGDQVRVSWTNLSSYATIEVFVDGESIGTDGPNDNGDITDLIEVGGLPPGEHTIGIQASCAGDQAAELVEGAITILEETPHTNPIDGLSCEFLPGDAGSPDQTVTTWTSADPSTFFDLWVRDTVGNRGYLGAFPGDWDSIAVVNTVPEFMIELQFFQETEDGNCYGSDILSCQPSAPGNIFIRGGCDGTGGTPQITSAVFGLGFLFGGEGANPPCVEACDTNGDGDVNISDMVHILTFLFGGGAPPAGWPDKDTGVCETASENCETGLESCPF